MAAYRQAYVAARNCKAQQQSPVLFPPPAGPYSAYLLIEEDEDGDNGDSASASCCWVFFKGNLTQLPFPQDKCLTIQYTTRNGKISRTEYDSVYFIPVLGQPISSHCYYVMQAEGKHKGLVETGSTKEDMATIYCCRCVKNIGPRSFQPTNSYQHMQIISSGKYRFTSKCIASDGFPPHFLRGKTWSVVAKDMHADHGKLAHVGGENTDLRAVLPLFDSSLLQRRPPVVIVGDMRGHHGRLAHVGGENAELRAQLPHFDFSLLQRMPPIVIVGEWYCPFIFINELGTRLEDPKIQLMECPFYKMDLEKFWEEIYSTRDVTGKDIHVDKTLKVEEALLFGKEVREEIRDNDGSVLFKGAGKQFGQATGVKLSWPIIAKMRADQDRYGLEQGGRDIRVKKSFSGSGMEGKFACYVVVERYVLKRMDGSIALTYSFRNSNQIQGKWEL